MIDYIYDGSFEGLLTTIFYTFIEKEPFTIFSTDTYSPNLFNNNRVISFEEDKFKRVYTAIDSKLSPLTLKKIYYVYLSNKKNKELLIYNYLKLCFKYSDNINLAKNNDIIINIDKTFKAVSKEAHLFTGLVRFREISPLTFYSKIQPDNNILPIILDHFTKRFSDQNFIIHDINREIAIVYNQQSSIISSLCKCDVDNFLSHYNNDSFEDLFKTFYSSLNIKERANNKVQKQHMPSRYWKNLTELQ